MKNLWKWFRWVILAFASLVYGLVGNAILTALRTKYPVGFQIIQINDADEQPFTASVLYPIRSRTLPTTLLGTVHMNEAQVSKSDLPIVLISHGNGGGPASQADVALTLADAGHIVAAPVHTTNTKPVLKAHGSRVEFPSVAGHFSFLTPCGIKAQPELFLEQSHFDRKAFHAEMNTVVIGSFEKNLRNL